MSNKRIIGFDRTIKLEWLQVTASWVAQGAGEKDVWIRLEDLLQAAIGGKEARRKTKTVLLHVWINVPEDLLPMRDEGLTILQGVPHAQRLAVHWGMCLSTYPFFYDLAMVVGRLLRLQGNVAVSQLTRRIQESWGGRSTLPRAIQRAARSLIEWSVLRESGAKGVYEAGNIIDLGESKRLAAWLTEAAVRASGGSMTSFSQTVASPALFPFSLGLTPRDLKQNERLEVVRQGLDQDFIALVAPSAGAK